MNKAVYIGAGLDIIPILVLPLNEFIYIDSLPKTQYGAHKLPIPECDLYRPTFLPNLHKILQNNHFVCVSEQANYIEYRKNNQILKYYINTAFPTQLNDEIKNQLQPCENLIICGFHPDLSIVDYMPNLKTIVCNLHTSYSPDDSESFIIQYLASHQKKYKFQLMKENSKYDYWDTMKIDSSIKNNYTICNVSGFDEIETIKPGFDEIESIKLNNKQCQQQNVPFD